MDRIVAEIDQRIGEKIKLLRKSQGLSQIQLAEKIGLSFQQVQKYEKGISSISAYRLIHIAEALGVHPNTFFQEDLSSRVSGPTIGYGSKGPVALPPVQLLDKDEITLLKLFREIRNRKVRQGLLTQLKGIAELINR